MAPDAAVPLRALIVDDEHDNALFIAHVLETGLGMTTLHCASGQEALNKIDDFAPHIALVDIRMPKMSGVELVVPLRQHAPGLPIIMMTAYSTVAAIVTTPTLPVQAFLTKPVGVGPLKETVEKVLTECATGITTD